MPRAPRATTWVETDDGQPGHDILGIGDRFDNIVPPDERNEPWRWRCPECDATAANIDKRIKRVGMVKNYSETPNGEKMWDRYSLEDVADYYCNSCKQPIDELVDKKEEYEPAY